MGDNLSKQIDKKTSEIKALLDKENVYGKYESSIMFSYLGEQKINNPIIKLSGNEKVKAFNQFYLELYNLCCKGKSISLETFMKESRNLIFENKFNANEIKEYLKSKAEIEITDVRRVFGLDIKENLYSIGIYTFIKKGYIVKYLQDNNILIQESDTIYNCLQETNVFDKYVFVAVKHRVLDPVYSSFLMDNDISLLISTIKYMTLCKNDKWNIGNNFSNTSSRVSIQFDSTGSRVLTNLSRDIKNISFEIDSGYYIDSNNGNDKIWGLLFKKEKNDMENRILSVINWISKALDEKDEGLVTAEIAFAFEALFKFDIKGLVQPSIVAGMAENYAFINGKNYEERISMEKDFKEMYGQRSKIAHGCLGEDGNVKIMKYFSMLKLTIYNLLTNEYFSKCNTLENLHNLIQKLKYS